VLGAWFFAEGAGSTASDSSGRGNHGTLQGEGKWDSGGVVLDGLTDYVNVPHSGILMPSDSITTGWSDGYGFYYTNTNTVGFFVQNYSRIATATLNPLAENTLKGTYDGTKIRTWVNGVEGTPYATTGIITPNTAPLELGRGRDNLSNINGVLKWVQVSDTV